MHPAFGAKMSKLHVVSGVTLKLSNAAFHLATSIGGLLVFVIVTGDHKEGAAMIGTFYGAFDSLQLCNNVRGFCCSNCIIPATSAAS